MSGIETIKGEVKEVLARVRNEEAWLKVVGAGAVGLVALTLVVGYAMKPSEVVRTIPINAVKKELDLPPGYTTPFPEVVQKEPEVREVIRYIEPEEPVERTYRPDEIFSFSQPAKPEVDQTDLKRLEIEESRKSYTWQRPKKEFDPYGYETQYEDISEDPDFSANNRPRSTPTYPVDLSRVLTADRIIPIVTITEIKSELPSQTVLGQVESNVFAAHGRKILIPRGSRAIGMYEPLDETGATRLAIAWNRIITPDGIDVKLESETADQLGSSGITGEVDEREEDRYGAALLFSSISALAQLSVSAGNQEQAAAADAFTGEFGTLTAELLRNSLDVVPRVTIKRGTRLSIRPLTDLWFKPSVTGEVQVLKLKTALANGHKVRSASAYSTGQVKFSK